MIEAMIITPWGQLSDGTRISQLQIDHPPTGSFQIRTTDMTNQPVDNIFPEPNTFIVRVICEESYLIPIRSDSNYFILSEEVI